MTVGEDSPDRPNYPKWPDANWPPRSGGDLLQASMAVTRSPFIVCFAARQQVLFPSASP